MEIGGLGGIGPARASRYPSASTPRRGRRRRRGGVGAAAPWPRRAGQYTSRPDELAAWFRARRRPPRRRAACSAASRLRKSAALREHAAQSAASNSAVLPRRSSSRCASETGGAVVSPKRFATTGPTNSAPRKFFSYNHQKRCLNLSFSCSAAAPGPPPNKARTRQSHWPSRPRARGASAPAGSSSCFTRKRSGSPRAMASLLSASWRWTMAKTVSAMVLWLLRICGGWWGSSWGQLLAPTGCLLSGGRRVGGQWPSDGVRCTDFDLCRAAADAGDARRWRANFHRKGNVRACAQSNDVSEAGHVGWPCGLCCCSSQPHPERRRRDFRHLLRAACTRATAARSQRRLRVQRKDKSNFPGEKRCRGARLAQRQHDAEEGSLNHMRRNSARPHALNGHRARARRRPTCASSTIDDLARGKVVTGDGTKRPPVFTVEQLRRLARTRETIERRFEAPAVERPAEAQPKDDAAPLSNEELAAWFAPPVDGVDTKRRRSMGPRRTEIEMKVCTGK